MLRQCLAELVRASLVLALVLFALAGTAPGQQQVGASAAVAASFAQSVGTDLCGGGWGHSFLAHAPCHACRASPPTLPPTPCAAEPAFRDVVLVEHVPSDDPGRVPPPLRRPVSRGPPAFA